MIDALTNLYSSLKEEDMFCAVWMRRCKKKSTATALSYEQHGLFDQASDHYFQVGIVDGKVWMVKCEW